METTPENDYLLSFRCEDCRTWFLFHPDKTDPTSSHGACKTCGSGKYYIALTDVTEKDVFLAKLSGKPLRYAVIEHNIA